MTFNHQPDDVQDSSVNTATFRLLLKKHLSRLVMGVAHWQSALN